MREVLRHPRFRTALVCAVVVLVTLVAWQRYRVLDRIVVEKFSGRPWAVPARIYADGFVLYPGLELEGTGFFERLRRLGYREVQTPVQVRGDFRRDPGGTGVDIYLHAFPYPLHAEAGRPVRIELARGAVTTVRALDDGEELFDLTLEPEALAGFYDRVWEERRVISLAEVPPRLVNAVLAIEDSRFFTHGAIDWRGIARAVVRNIAAGRIVEGGSTLTQQLMKNFFLSEARTFRRKAKELVMAIVAERRYSKEQILALYLNEIYLGQSGAKGIFGVGEAAQFYFGKDMDDLTDGDSALLAGIIRAPNAYSPFRNPERALARRNLVLAAMKEEGTLTAEQEERARAEPIGLRAFVSERNDAPYFVDFVRRELAASYPAEALTGEGLRIFTALDPQLQALAERTLRDGIEELERRHPRLKREGDQALQGALVALNPATGEIKAMVGGRDYRVTQFNRAADALRQPGSIFKPVVYFAALDPEGGPSHLLPTSQVTDTPFSWAYDGRNWTPANYEDRYLGRVTVRRALEMSLNAATARVAFQIGLPRVLDAAERLGMPGPLPALPAIVLGSLETTPLTVAQVYAVFASQGQRTPARAVKDVTDEHGQLIDRRPLAIDSVVSPRVTFLLTRLLEGVLDHGTGRPVRSQGFTMPAAGKTGTTNDYGDAWFAGYTPELVAVVWVGFDRRESLGLSGSQAALPIWTAFMRGAAAGRPARDFEVPSGVTMVTIDPESGLRATPGCPATAVEVFLDEDAPLEVCPLHGGAPIFEAVPAPGDRGRTQEKKSWWRRWF